MMRHYQFNRRPVLDATVAKSNLFLNYVFS